MLVFIWIEKDNLHLQPPTSKGNIFMYSQGIQKEFQVDARSLHGVRRGGCVSLSDFSSFLQAREVDSELQLISCSWLNFFQVSIKLEFPHVWSDSISLHDC